MALACAASGLVNAALKPLDEVRPLVGTGGHGHTYPGATVPFGFVQLSPDTRTDGWDACSGYHYSDNSILGFSHTHLSGTGGQALGDVLILPFTGKLGKPDVYEPLAAKRLAAPFSHENEIARPGYYRVQLDKYGVTAELTATAHAGMHRYTFPAGESHILIDLAHTLGDNILETSLKVESKTLITGQRHVDGWAKNRFIFFAIECSKPFAGVGLEVEDKMLPADQREANGKKVRAHLEYKTKAGQQIVLRVGLSATSVEAAKKNLQAEITTWDFDAVRQSAEDNWNAQLSRITIQSANPNIRQTFYSALYHSLLAPTLYNDADKSFRGADGKVHPPAGFDNYSTFSLWDTFRAQHPLLTLVQPERVNDVVRSMLAFYELSPDHALPMWPLANYETWCMLGDHALPVIADAYAKGFRDYDVEKVYEAMRATAMDGRSRQDEYIKLGYVPWTKGPYTAHKEGGTAKTLEYSLDDWSVAQMAKALGKTDDFELFSKRAQNYRNAWDPETRFFRVKTVDGDRNDSFDPKEVSNGGSNPSSGHYVEANAWQYAFSVFNDVPGMIELYGGKEAFVKRLEELFTQDSDMKDWRGDVTGIIGQYAHGDEPCHHNAYLFALAGAQHKTARYARQIMMTQYDNTPEGLCGNDDCGQISAWYVWSAMGLYPVNPANGVYVIGSPVVEKATIQLDPKYYKGGKFTIVAHDVSNQNIYIQSAKLNGKKYNRAWITHADVVKGGTLELWMGILPNKKWGGK